MATAKRNKIQAEIDKAREQLAKQQAQVRKLEAKRTEIENTEIVDIVRGLHIPLDSLSAILQNIKGGGINATAHTSGQLDPKSKETKTIINEEEEPDENED
jgi:hypothetical protein